MFLHELPVTGGPAGMTAAIYAARVFRWPREETWNHDVNFALISLEIILRYFRYISWNHLTKEFRLLQFQEMWISRSGLDGWNAMRFAPSRNPSPICVHWSSHLRWVDSSWPKESGKPILGLGVWCCFFSIPFWCFLVLVSMVVYFVIQLQLHLNTLSSTVHICHVIYLIHI